MDSLPHATNSFRFGIGEVLTLTDHQILKIPYLSALVSSGDSFAAARDDEGNYIIHENIKFDQFQFVIDSLSFKSIREIFHAMPKDYNPLSMIAQMDYLGLLTTPDPTLNEVDWTFFCVVVYDLEQEKYVHNVRPTAIQDMAVQFTIALIREAYDHTNRQVLDRIYWYIMFILSNNELFSDVILQHVYNVAANYFTLFKPSLLTNLDQLRCTKTNFQETDQRMIRIPYGCRFLDDILWVEYGTYSHVLCTFRPSLFRIWYSNYDEKFMDVGGDVVDLRILKPLLKLLVHTIYERMENKIYQNVKHSVQVPANLLQLLKPVKFRRREKSPRLSLMYGDGYNYRLTVAIRDAVERIMKEKLIREMFQDELAQENNQQLIRDEIVELKSELETKHRQALQQIEEHKELYKDNPRRRFRHIYSLHFQVLKHKQKKALVYELLLDESSCKSAGIPAICNVILARLYDAARNQITGWLMNKYKAIGCCVALASSISPNINIDELKVMQQSHRKLRHKPAPTKQLNFCKRRFD